MQIRSYIQNAETALPEQFAKKNPFTGQILHSVDSCGPIEIVKAIQSAQKGFAEWKKSSFTDRIQLLQAFAAVLEAHQDEYAKLEALDQGLPFKFVKQYSIQSAIKTLNNVIQELYAYKPTENKVYSPMGVIAIICTWNLSLRVISERLFAALGAGNTVIVKVSSDSPVTAVILQKLIRQCKAPEGLIQVVTSNQAEVKNLLVTHPGIKAVSFVGQLQTAAEILKQTSAQSLAQFKKIQISSGSKNTAVALTEPNDEIFKLVTESFMIGQGQLGWNSSRLFILEKHEEAWKQKLQDYLGHLKPCESIDDETSLWTPCIKKESFETFAELNSLARADQARLLQAGYPLNESQKHCYLPVTFTQDMSNCSTLQQDQVLAPLFILSTVKYPFDVAKYSNVSYFGLAAHLYGVESKLDKVAESLEVGLVCKNKWSVQVDGPTPGIKQSAFGIQDYRVFGDFFANVKNLT